MTSNHSTQLISQLSSELRSRHSLPVSEQWLNSFISTVRNPPPPLLALTSTAHFRLLNSDFTQSLSNTVSTGAALLPTNLSDPNIKVVVLTTNTPVQVLAIEDVGSSKWSQIEAIERIERGEEIRGREVIRNVPIMNEDLGDGSTGTAQSGGNATALGIVKKSAGPHKLLLQDAAGQKVYGFESVTVPKVFITMTQEEGGLSIGCKLMLKKGCVVRRGMVMLRPEEVTMLGGRVDQWDKTWRTGRKGRLIKEIREQDQT